jgi:hypothetical protein
LYHETASMTTSFTPLQRRKVFFLDIPHCFK